jgi:hypothetical protein
MNLKNYYKGLAGIYFSLTINSIVKLGDIDKTENTILDFGSGYGYLKKNIKKAKVINFDKIKNFTDVHDWKHVNFNVFVSNQVFYELTEEEINKIFDYLKKFKKDTMIIIGISNQNLLSKIGMFVLNYKNAHKKTITTFNDQKKIINKYCEIIKEKNNFFVNTVILCKIRS